jgi:N-acetylglucosaminyldiphosphoundecaprenol N-acetyl-beta-D-mannosaminyltransferase
MNLPFSPPLPPFSPSLFSNVLGYQVAKLTLEQATTWCLQAVQDPTPKLLVTTNPEIIVQAETNPELKKALLSADLTVADGVGVVWASKQFGDAVPERVPGVELAAKVLGRGGSSLRVFFLGSKPGVAQKAAEEATKKYGTLIAGVQHGYFKRPDDIPMICQQVKESKAHLLLAGLGEGQELFLHTNRTALNVPLMMGVGGTLDVMAGEVQRTPLWTRKVGLEWAYRVGLDRKRWHRFPRLLKFVKLVLGSR